jgi:hypothetical protein
MAVCNPRLFQQYVERLHTGYRSWFRCRRSAAKRWTQESLCGLDPDKRAVLLLVVGIAFLHQDSREPNQVEAYGRISSGIEGDTKRFALPH